MRLEISASAMQAMPLALKDMLTRVQAFVSADVLYLLVVFWLCRKAWSILGYVYSHTLKTPKDLVKCYGKWAVVTGASDGIGLAMATEMARQGNNVVLMSRTAAKLEEKAAAIRTQYPKVEVKIFAVDFMNIGDKKQRSDIQAFLAPLEVGVLVNNVGESYANPMYFDELSDEAVEKLTVLNVETTMWMTRIVLPQMLKAKKGAIINISSAAGVLTSPLLSQYGGAKGNVAQFSRALHYELASKGIHVQCQVPLYVTTKLAKLRHSSWSVATEKQYARAAIKAIGSGVVVSPYWSHALQMNLFSSLPEWLLAWATTKMHLGIRKAAQKKMADAAAAKANADGASKKD